MKRLLSLLLALLPFAGLRAADEFFKAGDVVALVGGEDLVAQAEAGDFEAQIVHTLPALKLKFRSLAWEGDTVYAQRRDLNYPLLEDQLQRIGATVILMEFGQMEMMDGEERLSDFVAAYERLIDRLAPGGTRRVALIVPQPPENFPNVPSNNSALYRACGLYGEAVVDLAKRRKLKFADLRVWDEFGATRDGIHLVPWLFSLLAKQLEPTALNSQAPPHLAQLIREKNRLWYNYARPQNWAFLAGDRTNQPSSRDHLDHNYRWFPVEMEQYLPLIDKLETEIAALSSK